MSRRLLPLAFAVALAFATAGRSVAEGRWNILHDGSLTLMGDQPPSTLRDIDNQITQFRAVIGGLIHNADRPSPIPTVVFVLGTRSAMEPLLPLYNGKPATIGGYFGQAGYANYVVMSLEGWDESSRITFHEYTHLLVRNAVKALPPWLGEGLAEYYSTYAVVDHGKAAVVGRTIASHILLLRTNYLPLAQIIAVDQKSPMYNEGSRRSIFYAESWALTHYLMQVRANGAAAINTYANEIAAGRPPDEAFTIAFGASTSDVDKELREYLHRFSYPAVQFTFKEKLAIPQLAPARAMTPGEVDAWMGDAQRRVRGGDEASRRIERAVVAEPDTAITQLALGLLRMSQQRTPESLAALERAARADPDDFFTQYVSGAAQLRVDPAGVKERAAQLIATLTRAITLDATSSDAFATLAFVQMQSRDTLAAAQNSIERAIVLAPGRLDYRLRYADVRVLQGDVDTARTLLTSIAAIKTDSVSSRAATMRLEAIAASGR